MYPLRRVVFALLAGTFFLSCGFGDGDQGPVKASSRKLVSQVSFVDAAGVQHSLAEYSGKVVVVDVWATWCPPCRASLPEVAALQKRGDDSFAVLAIPVDYDGVGKGKPFLNANPQMDLGSSGRTQSSEGIWRHQWHPHHLDRGSARAVAGAVEWVLPRPS